MRQRSKTKRIGGAMPAGAYHDLDILVGERFDGSANQKRLTYLRGSLAHVDDRRLRVKRRIGCRRLRFPKTGARVYHRRGNVVPQVVERRRGSDHI